MLHHLVHLALHVPRDIIELRKPNENILKSSKIFSSHSSLFIMRLIQICSSPSSNNPSSPRGIRGGRHASSSPHRSGSFYYVFLSNSKFYSIFLICFFSCPNYKYLFSFFTILIGHSKLRHSNALSHKHHRTVQTTVLGIHFTFFKTKY